nr:cleavage stimulating factor 64 [Ipomoea batatas]
MDHGQNMDTVLALPANPKANSFIKRDQGQKKDIVLALPAKSTANSFTTRPDTQSSTHVAAWLLLPLPSSVTQDRAMSAANIVGKSKKELYDIMSEMKKLMEQNEEQARQILIENPTLARDLFKAQIMLGMVQPTQPSPSHVNQSAPAGPNEKAAP